MSKKASKGVRLLVPDGSLKDVAHKLLADAGLAVSYPDGDRSYQGRIDNAALFPPPFNLATKMRPQDACWVVADGRADLAFAGNDLIAESGRQGEIEVLNQYPLSRAGVGKTKLVVAVPEKSLIRKIGDLKARYELATEYPNIAKAWSEGRRVKVQIRFCHGSLEAFNDFADAILENTETGHSLKVGGWRIIAEVMEVQCCLITHPAALGDPVKAVVIRQVKLLLDSVIAGRSKRLLKCNVSRRSKTTLSAVLALLPSADSPTISELVNNSGFAVETVVPADQVANLIIALKAAGATAIIDLPIARYAR